MSKQLIYLFYGKKKAYRQEVKFSILSALARQTGFDKFTIRVFTDSPEEFSGWPVEVVALDVATLDEWKGPFGYTHRRKACAIAAACQLADKTIFIDSDTIFLKDPNLLFDRVGSNKFLVDNFEWTWLKALKRQEYKELAEYLNSMDRSPDSSLKLYNSGVCGMARAHSPVLDSVIELIDEWGPLAANLHTVEQIALSFVLAGKQVNLASDCINHYYADKEFFHAMIAVFFYRHGEAFRPELVELSRKVPSVKPVPASSHRMLIKMRLMTVSRTMRPIAKMVMYGGALPRSPYYDAFRDAGWRKALEKLGGLKANSVDREWVLKLPLVDGQQTFADMYENHYSDDENLS